MPKYQKRKVIKDHIDDTIRVVIDNNVRPTPPPPPSPPIFTPSLLLHPMLGLTLFMCWACTEQNSKGPIVEITSGKKGLLVILCDHCLDWNAKLREDHMDDIVLHNER